MLWTGLSLLLLLGVAWPGAAQAARLALVIGNDDYAEITDLKNARADARTMAEALRAVGYDVTLRTDRGQREMLDDVRAFRQRIRGGDEVVFFFAGHGLQIGPSNYLLPTNVRSQNEDQVRDDALELSRVLADLRAAKPAFTLAIIDACRDNPFASQGRSIGGRGLTGVAGANGQMVIYAAGEGQQALDRVGPNDRTPNGLFTRVFASQLRQPGVPVHQVLRNVRGEVARVARTIGHVQVPAIYDQVEGEYFFVPGAGPGVGAANRPATSTASAPAETPGIEDEAWALCRNGRTVIPCQQYLEAWPQGRYASLARTRIRDLEATAAPVAQVPAAVAAPAGLTVGQVIQDCDVCPKLVVLPAGRFQMGSMDGDPDERPVREVSVAGFLMGQTEVTQGQWRAVMGSNPSHFKACGDDCPVEQVSWEEAQAYVKKLSERTGKVYRLPSEAEWEYAARAGSRTKWSFGDDEAKLGEHAWFGGNSGSKTLRVATRRPNGWGLYDMHGNVWEWVQDVWHDNYTGAPTDGSAWMAGGDQARRVLRGGSWYNTPQILRSANRNWNAPAFRDDSIGFRIARTF